METKITSAVQLKILKLMIDEGFELQNEEGNKIYVKDVVLHGMDKGKVELKHRKYRVVRPDKTYSGEIFVAVTFTKLNYENHKGKDGMEKEAWKS
ncbi:hypothetical protein LguiA_032184 [Lonicera macranthoides]